MLDRAGYPQMPTDLGALGRRVVALERQVQQGAAAHTLAKASVGRGGIRVFKGGSVKIEDGGGLEIVTGNLILGEGMIEGNALKNQLSAKSVYSNGAKGFSVGTSLQAYETITVTPPSWASFTIVTATAATYTQWNGDINDYSVRATIRIAGDGMAATALRNEQYGDGSATAGGTTTGADRVEGNKSFKVESMLQSSPALPAHGSNNSALRTALIFVR